LLCLPLGGNKFKTTVLNSNNCVRARPVKIKVFS
jgi:hypothetical protein